MIPTAETLLEKYEKEFKDNGIVFDLKKPMIEFAKLHVEQALINASENAIAKENPDDYGTGEIWVDKNSILNAYPLSNIK